MTGRACRASVINGTRRALAFALKRTISADLRVATNELRRRLGAAGRVQDDVLGCAPDLWDPVPLEIRTGGDDPANAGLRRSIEFLESQPWLPASARSITESRTAGDWSAAGGCSGGQSAKNRRIHMGIIMHLGNPPATRLPRKATDGSTSPGTVDRIVAVGFALGRDDTAVGGLGRRITMPRGPCGAGLYAPLTKCPCQSCVSRRIEIENARHSFFTRGADCAPIRRSPFNLS